MFFYSIILVLISSTCILAAPSLSRSTTSEIEPYGGNSNEESALSQVTASSSSGVELGSDGSSNATVKTETYVPYAGPDSKSENNATQNLSSYNLEVGDLVNVTDNESKSTAKSETHGGPNDPSAEAQASQQSSYLGVDIGEVGISASEAKTTAESKVSEGGVTSESQATSEVSRLDVKVGDVDLSLSESQANSEAKISSSGDVAESQASSGSSVIALGGGDSTKTSTGSSTGAEVDSYKPGSVPDSQSTSGHGSGEGRRTHGDRAGERGYGGGFGNGAIREGSLGIGRTTSEIFISNPVGGIVPPLRSNIVGYLDPCLRQGRVLG